jgi:pyridoxamine 5'-phosphate oxidase
VGGARAALNGRQAGRERVTVPAVTTAPDPRLDLPPELVSDPFARFAVVFARAKAADPKWADAMCLATVDAAGRPSARMVLLKSFDAEGFVFYTNHHSRKGRELLARPDAALCFHWSALEEQVRVEGRATPVDPAEADAYFASRARGSQIGAWASDQSSHLDGREVLEARVAVLEARFAGQPVPRPPHWSGFRIRPEAMEFWIGLESRLHDRTRYERDGDGWRRELLSP